MLLYQWRILFTISPVLQEHILFLLNSQCWLNSWLQGAKHVFLNAMYSVTHIHTLFTSMTTVSSSFQAHSSITAGRSKSTQKLMLKSSPTSGLIKRFMCNNNTAFYLYIFGLHKQLSSLPGGFLTSVTTWDFNYFDEKLCRFYPDWISSQKV